ncbi:MAG: T9SS type A sorting domain-containing protein [Cyclobacteriaceae bacterium]
MKIFLSLILLFSISYAHAQIDCENIKVAVQGDNVVSGSGDQWFTYTMSNDNHRLKIDNMPASTEQIIFWYNNSCDNLNLLDNQNHYRDSNSGDVFFIKITVTDWTLRIWEEPILDGTRCHLAFPAVFGENEYDYASSNYYWYSYTMKNDYYRPAINESIPNEIYKNSCEQLELVGYLDTLRAGETVYFRKRFGDTGTFTLSEQPHILQTGEVCALAKPAQLGENIYETSHSVIWYSYTIQNDDHYLKARSNTSVRVSLFANNCGVLESLGTGHPYASTDGLKAGDEVLIRWNGGIHYSNFTWSLFEIPIDQQATDQCAFAVPAQLGSNIMTDSVGSHWYSYTMTYDQLIIEHSRTTGSHKVSVYINSCDNLVLMGTTSFDRLASIGTFSGFSPGEVVYIRWHSGNKTWYLKEGVTTSPREPANSCQTATTAVQGLNTVPVTSSQDYWYTYTMNDVQLTINSPQSDSHFAVYTNNCDSLVQLGWGYKKLTLSGLTPGEKIYVKWIRADGFDWELKVGLNSDYIPTGLSCEDAIEALVGENKLRNNYWLTYVMKNDNHRLTLNGEREPYAGLVTVYKNNCDSLIKISTRLDDISIPELNAGERVYIRWVGGRSNTWSLSEEPQNLAPNITEIEDQTIDENSSTAELDFSIYDIEDEAGSITLIVSSNNQSIVPDDKIILGGSAENRTLQITPNEYQYGKVSISIIATDTDGHSNVSSFVLTINAINNSPEISTPLEDVYLVSGFDSSQVDISNVFSDADNDVLNIESIAKEPGVVDVSVSGNILNINEVGVGTVEVVLIADDGIGEAARDTFSINVSPVLSASYNPIDFELYPNPTSKYLNFRIRENYGSIEIKIYNMLGVEVFSQRLNNAVDKIDISKLSSGVYFLKLKNTQKENVYILKKVIKL